MLFLPSAVFDEDYTGHLRIVVENRGERDYVIQKDDRFCQVVFQPYVVPENIVYLDELPTTERGSKGLGSSGIGVTKEADDGYCSQSGLPASQSCDIDVVGGGSGLSASPSVYSDGTGTGARKKTKGRGSGGLTASPSSYN
jgi:dUTPase